MMNLGMSLAVGVLLLLTFGACERQGQPPKPIGSATNKHVEETPSRPSPLEGSDLIQKSPREEARQAEDLLKDTVVPTR